MARSKSKPAGRKRSRLAIVPKLLRSAVRVGVIPVCALATEGCAAPPVVANMAPVVANMGNQMQNPVAANFTAPPPVVAAYVAPPPPPVDAGAGPGATGDAGVQVPPRDAGPPPLGVAANLNNDRRIAPVVAAQLPPPNKNKKPSQK